MVDKVVRVRECNLPGCPEPENDVKRLELTDVDKKQTFQVDACVLHRKTTPYDELVEHAHKRGRRRGIKVVNPEDIPRGRQR